MSLYSVVAVVLLLLIINVVTIRKFNSKKEKKIGTARRGRTAMTMTMKTKKEAPCPAIACDDVNSAYEIHVRYLFRYYNLL